MEQRRNGVESKSISLGATVSGTSGNEKRVKSPAFETGHVESLPEKHGNENQVVSQSGL